MKTASFLFNDSAKFDLKNLRIEIQNKLEKDRAEADETLKAIEKEYLENREQRIKEEVRKILLNPKPENTPVWENKGKWTKPRTMAEIEAQAERIVDDGYVQKREQHIRSTLEKEEILIKKELNIIEPVRDPKDIKYPDLK